MAVLHYQRVSRGYDVIYPPVNIQKAMENGSFIDDVPMYLLNTIELVILHSYVSLPEGNHQCQRKMVSLEKNRAFASGSWESLMIQRDIFCR